jgi:hypothetical protein
VQVGSASSLTATLSGASVIFDRYTVSIDTLSGSLSTVTPLASLLHVDNRKAELGGSSLDVLGRAWGSPPRIYDLFCYLV